MTNTPTEQQMPLKPCPFDGTDAMIEQLFIDDDPTPWYVATCHVCPVKTYDQSSAEEAARIWNTRATTSPSEAARALNAAIHTIEAYRHGNVSHDLADGVLPMLRVAVRTDKKGD